MKSTRQQRGTRPSKRQATAGKGSRKPVDLAQLRDQIKALAGNDALGMVETTIEEVGKGHYLGMKYLFEMIGLHSAPGVEETPARESMAGILLPRLGLPEAPEAEQPVTKESETSPPATNDGLE
jgi:hypothetical protein